MGEPLRVIGYVRASTEDQEASLVVQHEAITSECQRRGWTLVRIEVDRCSGKTLDRPGAQAVFAALRAGLVDVLMVHKIDRLSRSMVDFANVLARSVQDGWQLVALDLGVDTTKPNGRFIAQVMAAVAELEREMIAQRTREALAQKRAEGIHTGRRSNLSDALVERIVRMRTVGHTLRSIASTLNEEGVPTGQGAPAWTTWGVRAVLATLRAKDLLKEERHG